MNASERATACDSNIGQPHRALDLASDSKGSGSMCADETIGDISRVKDVEVDVDTMNFAPLDNDMPQRLRNHDSLTSEKRGAKQRWQHRAALQQGPDLWERPHHDIL